MDDITFSFSAQPDGFDIPSDDASNRLALCSQTLTWGGCLSECWDNSVGLDFQALQDPDDNPEINNWICKSSTYWAEDRYRYPQSADLQIIYNGVLSQQDIQNTETLPPRLSIFQTYTCLKIQDDLDEKEEEEMEDGEKRKKTERVATDANLFCELSLGSTSRESGLIKSLAAGDHDLTLTSFDISQHISGLNVRYSAGQNAITFSFQLCAVRIPTEAILRDDYFGEGTVTVVSEINLTNHPHYAAYLASLANTGLVRLGHHVSQLRVLFKFGLAGEELRHPDKLLVSFDIDPTVVVPESDLLHEDVEDWATRMQQTGWFQLECEGVLSPSFQLEPDLPPEDASAQVPLYIKQGIPYQPGWDTGGRGEVRMRHESNNRPCVRGMAATLEEVNHPLRCRISQLGINQDTGNGFWNVVI